MTEQQPNPQEILQDEEFDDSTDSSEREFIEQQEKIQPNLKIIFHLINTTYTLHVK